MMLAVQPVDDQESAQEKGGGEIKKDHGVSGKHQKVTKEPAPCAVRGAGLPG
jgi:hypothetical protein